MIPSQDFLLRISRTGFLLLNVSKVNVQNIFHHALAVE